MAIECDPKADYYVTLGLANGATADDIKTAHRERIRDLHPDDSVRAAISFCAHEGSPRLTAT
jgi:DnaJ-class molecular chaperone